MMNRTRPSKDKIADSTYALNITMPLVRKMKDWTHLHENYLKKQVKYSKEEQDQITHLLEAEVGQTFADARNRIEPLRYSWNPGKPLVLDKDNPINKVENAAD